MSASHDPLQLPLAGISPVSASAGTGKTFTIATLYLRLILEQGLNVDEIVVATFTRAAAAELATRLAERLRLADLALGAPDPQAPYDDDSGEMEATRRVIAQALQGGIAADTLRQRAHDACLGIDTACIGTLHGFFHQALREFGFEAGAALRPSELIDDARALADEILRDFWRQRGGNATDAALLTDTWGSPDELARQVHDPRWRGRERERPEPDIPGLQAAFAAARARIAKWTAKALAVAQAALPDCVSHPPTLKKLSQALADVHAWAGTGQRAKLSDADALALAAKFSTAALDKLQPQGQHANGPAFDDLAALCAAQAELLAADAARAGLPQAELLDAARSLLDSELPRRLAERHLVDHDSAIDALAAALEPPHGAELIRRLQGRWKAALVDEFQDTDSTQYAIVKALFGGTTLIFVGDPKQAIYGFRGGDVYAWQQALADADAAHPKAASLQLTRSFRAGQGLCAAFNALFSQPGSFIEPLEHPDIDADPSVRERAVLRDGHPLAALQCWWLDPETIGHAERSALPSKDRVEAAVEDACVAWIANALADPALSVRGKDGTAEPLQPRHIAVLVDKNAQALSLQAALARAGVPATSNLVASVYASAEADDVALLLAALAAPDDVRRARAAHASVLVGWDAARIAAQDADHDAALLETIAAWAQQLHRRGPAAWLNQLLQGADGAPRLLGLPDGPRRVANYLHLGELLQQLAAQNVSAGGLADAFARARSEAAGDDTGERLRADVDTGAGGAAGAVTVSTIHAAKGLEYTVVLVPYAVLGHDPERRNGKQPRLYWYHAGTTGHVAIGDGASAAIRERAALEARAEDVRKLYVAVTRASALCILPYGPTSATAHSALHHLLQIAGRTPPLADTADDCRTALEALRQRAPDAIEIVADLPALATTKRTRSKPAPAPALHARAFNDASVERDWSIWSFSRLARGGHGGDPAPGAGDHVALDAGVRAHVLAGPRFGTAVHAVFERTDFAAWRDARTPSVAERALVEHCLRHEGLPAAGASLPDAVTQVAECVRGALNATLPCGARLCDIDAGARRAEIEFHLALKPTASAQLCTLLREHHYLAARQSFSAARLNGLLTGKIDLVFRHAGQFHVVDWKTNLCATYDAASLAAEIARHEYDLQWLIYTLALHRWLGAVLPGYAYARDVGEVYYLFVRGMAAGGGIHRATPTPELIAALDGLFRGEVST